MAKKPTAAPKTRESRALPLGEERDGLRKNAEAILGSGTPKKSTGSYAPWMEDDDLPLTPRSQRVTESERSWRHPQDVLRQAAEDERIMRERASITPRNPFRRDEGDVPFSGNGDSFNSPFVKLAGITFTKKQFMELLTQDLPRLMREAKAEETVRGKLLRGTMIPAIQELMTEHGFYRGDK
jgi:hypothetical protein